MWVKLKPVKKKTKPCSLLRIKLAISDFGSLGPQLSLASLLGYFTSYRVKTGEDQKNHTIVGLCCAKPPAGAQRDTLSRTYHLLPSALLLSSAPAVFSEDSTFRNLISQGHDLGGQNVDLVSPAPFDSCGLWGLLK